MGGDRGIGVFGCEVEVWGGEGVGQRGNRTNIMARGAWWEDFFVSGRLAEGEALVSDHAEWLHTQCNRSV